MKCYIRETSGSLYLSILIEVCQQRCFMAYDNDAWLQFWLQNHWQIQDIASQITTDFVLCDAAVEACLPPVSNYLCSPLCFRGKLLKI